VLRIRDSHAIAGTYVFEACSNMPKQKTHKGTKKRFRLTAKGKAKHRQAGTSHLAFRLTPKRKRNLRGTAVLAKPMEKAIRRALNGNSS
jgi:large subunit ribosomal protein L35